MKRTPEQKAAEFAQAYGGMLDDWVQQMHGKIRQVYDAHGMNASERAERLIAYHQALRQILPRKDAHPQYMRHRRRALIIARRGDEYGAHAAARRIADHDELAAIEGLIFGRCLHAEVAHSTPLERARNPRR